MIRILKFVFSVSSLCGRPAMVPCLYMVQVKHLIDYIVLNLGGAREMVGDGVERTCES